LAKLVLDINVDRCVLQFNTVFRLHWLACSRKEEKTMGKFFDSLDTTLFPALREIQAFDLSWPTTEYVCILRHHHVSQLSFQTRNCEMPLGSVG
jgi:hypothetical protein